jgi:PadR family transcriptional regulator
MSDPVDLQALVRAINQALILAVLRNGPKHGYQIAVEAEASSEGMFAFQHGTLYPILHRLEKERLISGRWETVDGRRRKVYSLTARGRERLSDESAHIRSAFDMLTSVLEAGE